MIIIFPIPNNSNVPTSGVLTVATAGAGSAALAAGGAATTIALHEIGKVGSRSPLFCFEIKPVDDLYVILADHHMIVTFIVNKMSKL